KGVHVYPHWFGVPINDRLYYPIYAKCCELGVPITLQVGTHSMRSGAKCVGRPILLDDVAFDFPDLKLIGLHLGAPWLEEMVMLAKAY
ncbi:amidohydrolase family protein, partial [Listeria monocytogenes]|uniref:amidohydrolase family protein n=1 Tax=Listeria monocytogenes TaxID=1639 RepID=UPI003FA41C22